MRITARVGKTMQTVDARVLMLASGRTSNTGGLGCKAAGVKLDAYGTIETDIEMRTSQKHIWAAGDVDGGMQLRTRRTTRVAWPDTTPFRASHCHAMNALCRA